MSNRNIYWAEIFVNALAQAGLKHVCIAPGSRHTPLVLAFAKNVKIQKHTHLDERSMAFFALGLAKASGKAVALVCTSGTAGANFYPAIIEAHQSQVPLLVLTADRPPELRHSGANQTINQLNLFGDYALWFVDMALPEANPPDIAIRNLQTTASRALATANGIRKGVVHLNFPFRKPLEPTPVVSDSQPTFDRKTVTYMMPAVLELDYDVLDAMGTVLMEHSIGFIICGTDTAPSLLDSYNNISSIKSFSLSRHFPIFSDAIGGLRFNDSLDVLGGYENYLGHEALDLSVDIIVRFGRLPLSKQLNNAIQHRKFKYYWHVSPDNVWNDDSHLVTSFVPSNSKQFFSDFEHYPSFLTTWLPKIHKAEEITWQVIDEEIQTGDYFDGGVVYDVVDLFPPDSTLFVGNSLPVRLLDQFGKPQLKNIYTMANRGASGIDGNISTALGAGKAFPDRPLVAIVGDTTFYHDMNGLLAVQRLGIPITIILLNNDGGGIFHRLSIKNFEPQFTEYFIMSHGLDYSHTAQLYGLDYIRADDRATFRLAFEHSINNRTATIIEVRTDAQHDLQRRDEIVKKIHDKIDETI